MLKTTEVVGVGRDSVRVYRITEMPAYKAEKWAIRALWAIAGAGVDLPDSIDNAPLAELVKLGLKALFKVPYAQIEPLLDEMLGCVTVLTDAGARQLLLKDDFEDPRTLIKIRKEVFSLHTDFFMQD
jgi:hypothetical protein